MLCYSDEYQCGTDILCSLLMNIFENSITLEGLLLFNIVYMLKVQHIADLCFPSELLYNLTADADKRYKGLSSRVYFTLGGEQTGVVGQNFNLRINQQECHHYTTYVRVGPF